MSVRLLNTIEQTGELLGGTSRSKIYELIDEKQLEAVKMGRRTMITGASIDAYVERLPRGVDTMHKGRAARIAAQTAA